MDKEKRKNTQEPPAGYTPETWERQRMLSRFLEEINSKKKPSDEIIDWWLGQY